MGENEIDYNLSAQNAYIVSTIFLNISYERDSISTKHNCFQGENLLFKRIKCFFFQKRFNQILIPIYFS